MSAEQARIVDWVCPFCSLACDDLTVAPTPRGGVSLAGPECPLARAALIEAGTPEARPALIEGRAAPEQDAVAHAASLLAASAAPLIAGLGCEVDGVRAALALADRCGAAVDHLRADGLMRLLVPLIERGAVQTTLSEARNRADRILVLGPDPRRIAPRLFERVLPASGLFLDAGAPRSLVFLAGAPEASLEPHLLAETIAAPPARLAELAGAVRRLVLGRTMPAAEIGGVPRERLAMLAQWMREARYGVVLFAPGLIDFAEAELAVAAILTLVQELNRGTRWAALPVAGPDGVIGASQAMLWQSGVPLRSRFTDRGPRFDPRRLSAERMLARSEADLLVWISALSPTPPPQTERAVIALTHPATRFQRQPEVLFPVAVPGVDQGGAVFRTDGVIALHLTAARRSPRPRVAEILGRIAAALPEHAG